MPAVREIQIVAASSILGLRPSGVETLASALLSNGLETKIGATTPVIHAPTLNHLYTSKRSNGSILNEGPLKDFSIDLGKIVREQVSQKKFTLVLGGDCSIMIGVMLGLKSMGSYGLFFIDAHADFYQPEKSPTGEAADMDLALITGRGPDNLTNIGNARPYVKDEHVVHFGQRDMEETIRYGSQDIRDTSITCYDVEYILTHGVRATVDATHAKLNSLNLNGYWIHFDTDVIDDQSNPAVDYRLPGGLSFKLCRKLLTSLVTTFNIVGTSITILNPALDPNGLITRETVTLLSDVFDSNKN
jgi:arginase